MSQKSSFTLHAANSVTARKDRAKGFDALLQPTLASQVKLRHIIKPSFKKQKQTFKPVNPEEAKITISRNDPFLESNAYKSTL